MARDFVEILEPHGLYPNRPWHWRGIVRVSTAQKGALLILLGETNAAGEVQWMRRVRIGGPDASWAAAVLASWWTHREDEDSRERILAEIRSLFQS